MSFSNKLERAKKQKQDEFYTQYSDIESEIELILKHNPEYFNNKSVFCPCDNYEISNFTKYFVDNFDRLKLNSITSTSYSKDSNGRYFCLTRGKKPVTGLLKDNGDFRTKEVKDIRNKSDVIITNPPFSLFREFFEFILLAKNKPQFLILGSLSAISYKILSDRIIKKEIRLGVGLFNKDTVFKVPDDYKSCKEITQKLKKLGYNSGYTLLKNCCWFTNIEYSKPATLELISELENKNAHKNSSAFLNRYLKKYDNQNAYEVQLLKSIPSDLGERIIGVPLTFVYYYNPDEFKILCLSKDLTIDGKNVFKRFLIQKVTEKRQT